MTLFNDWATIRAEAWPCLGDNRELNGNVGLRFLGIDTPEARLPLDRFGEVRFPRKRGEGWRGRVGLSGVVLPFDVG